MEFARTLESRQCPGSLNQVIGAVRSGANFEDNLKKGFGRTLRGTVQSLAGKLVETHGTRDKGHRRPPW